MAALSLGARAKITGFARYAEAIPFLVQLFEQIENWSRRLGTDNLDMAAIITYLFGSGSGFARVASGTYIGDGTTANRVITTGTWTPKRVVVLRTDATAITFESIGSTGDTRAWYRAAAGTYGNSTTHWQGITAGGFKCGTSAVGDSNAAGVTYSYWVEG